MDTLVRKAVESDRFDIALCIAEAFKREFIALSKDSKVIANAIKDGLLIEKFFVAIVDDKVAGTIAVTDSSQRATDVSSMKLYKNLGIIKGFFANSILKEEFESPLDFPTTTGYIEFVAVKEKFRGAGISSLMLENAIKSTNYENYALDVTDVNHVAIKIYEKFGFEEFKRIPVKRFAKQKGFNAKIYMRLNRN